MALLMFDGFEPYNDRNQMAQSSNWKYIYLADITTTGYEVRTGGRALELGNSTNYVRTKDLGDAKTIILGMGVRLQSVLSADGNTDFLRFETGDNNVYLKGYRNQNPITVEAYNNGALLGSFTMAESTYVYLEVKLTVDNTAGALEARINGETVLSLTNIDTQPGANAFVRNVLFYTSTNIFYYSVDDLYICDDSGTRHNDFLGPVQVLSLAPASDAAVTWTPDSGVDIWSRVDEAVSDGDTSYVETAVIGNKDFYGAAALPANVTTPLAVSIVSRARLADPGRGQLATLVKSSTTEVEATAIPNSTDWRFAESDLHAVDPDTGTDWTREGVNALEIGQVAR